MQQQIKFDKKQIFGFLFALTAFALILRLLIGYGYIHRFDLNYYDDWSSGLAEHGLFQAYNKIETLDYPPVFLFPLYLVGLLRRGLTAFSAIDVLLLKLFQILFDAALVPLIYFVLRRLNGLAALGMAALWAISPVMIVNSAMWGQTDSMMLFFLLLAFYLLDVRRPIAATVVYAICGLTKYQTLYFAPVFLLFLFYRYGLRKGMLSFGCGILTGVAVFFPFMLHSGITLPFSVYFGATNVWTGASMNAFNLYAALGLNYVDDTSVRLGPLNLHSISLFITILIILALLVLFAKSKNASPSLLCFLIMQSLFMFTTRMHERYQIPALLFLMVAALVHHSRRLMIDWFLLTWMVAANQFIVFDDKIHADASVFHAHYPVIAIVLSFVNLALYLLSLKDAVAILFSPSRNAASPAPEEENARGIAPQTGEVR